MKIQMLTFMEQQAIILRKNDKKSGYVATLFILYSLFKLKVVI